MSLFVTKEVPSWMRLLFITQSDSQHRVREQVEAYLLGGGKLVQYRAKRDSREKLFQEASHLASLCEDFGGYLMVNDYVEVARETGAAGVHLGLKDAPPERAREALGEKAIIGATAHSIKELDSLKGLPIDYIGLGPFKHTQTKRNLPPPHGIGGMRTLVAHAKKTGLNLPIFAIGGIEDIDVRDLLQIGCYGVAISSRIALASDPQHATRRFLERIERNAI